jgi:hypothetical protein
MLDLNFRFQFAVLVHLRLIRQAIFVWTLIGVAMAASPQAKCQQVDYHAIRGRVPTRPEQDRLEGESDLPKRGTSRAQSLTAYGPQWSGGSHLLWDGTVGEECSTEIVVEASGIYDLKFQFTRASDYGRFEIRLDGVSMSEATVGGLTLRGKDLSAEVDLFAESVSLAPPVWLKSVELKKGIQPLTFKLRGANPQAHKFKDRGYLMGLDYVELHHRNQPNLETKTQIAERTTLTPQPTLKRLVWNEFYLHLSKHCFDCHNEATAEADLILSKFESFEELGKQMNIVQKMHNALTQKEMPPEDSSELSDETREALKVTLDSVIQEHLSRVAKIPEVVMRRMNRLEYNNAVRDLLHLRGDIYPLPEKTLRAGQPYFDPATGRFPKSIVVGNRTLGKNQVERQILTGVSPYAVDLQAEGGFNNRGEDLSVSPLLMENFVALGQAILAAPEFEGYCQIRAELFDIPSEITFDQKIELAANRLSPLLERAFRSPVEPDTLDRYVAYFGERLEATGDFRASMKQAIAALLASPRFLFVISQDEESDDDSALAPYRLASRLSFFLWSSIPDEELLATAKNREILNPEVLRQQTERMLADPKCQSLSQNFARQWLRLDQLITAVPDFERFPEYYSRIGCEQWKLGLQSMMEPLLLFESILVEDRSIMLLIDSNYTYRSDELHSWYEETVPFAQRENRNRFNTGMQTFSRRSLNDRRQGGALTTAATMTMTSAPLRTSPIVRGAWVATVFLNQPPPPPPDDIESIEADDREIESQGITLRQRLRQHQVNVACTSCHAKIDPLGFALENYDAVGRWRKTYTSGLPIDTQGRLLGQYPFADAVELKERFLDHPEIFMTAFSEHLLSYALGRALKPEDTPVIEHISSQALSAHGQFSSLVHAIVQSPLFIGSTPRENQEN